MIPATLYVAPSYRISRGVVMSGYSERQEDEIEFLQAVFPAGELEDLRLKDPWKVFNKRIAIFINESMRLDAHVDKTSSWLASLHQ